MPYLIDVLDHQAFRQGDTFTCFLDQHFASWSPVGPDEETALMAAALDNVLPKKRAAAARLRTQTSYHAVDTLGHWRM